MPRAQSTRVYIKQVIMRIPTIFSIKPVLIKSRIERNPVLYATAFGGVATGSMNARDEVRAAVSINKIGLIIRLTEVTAKIGIITDAIAVLEVTSVRNDTNIATNKTMNKTSRTDKPVR